MPLSARDRQILADIEHHFAAADPGLASTLARGEMPGLARRLLAVPGKRGRGCRWWATGIFAPLIFGITLLAAGLTLNMAILVWLGVPIAQVGPIAVGCIYRKVHPAKNEVRNVRSRQ